MPRDSYVDPFVSLVVEELNKELLAQAEYKLLALRFSGAADKQQLDIWENDLEPYWSHVGARIRNSSLNAVLSIVEEGRLVGGFVLNSSKKRLIVPRLRLSPDLPILKKGVAVSLAVRCAEVVADLASGIEQVCVKDAHRAFWALYSEAGFLGDALSKDTYQSLYKSAAK